MLDATPSLAINALTTDVIIDMDCDLPENKHLSHVLVVQVREGGAMVRPYIRLFCRRQWIYLQAHRPQQDRVSGLTVKSVKVSLYHPALVSTGVCPIVSEIEPT